MCTVQTPPPGPVRRISKVTSTPCTRSSRSRNGSDSRIDCAEVSVKRVASMSRCSMPWRTHQRAIDAMIGSSERPIAGEAVDRARAFGARLDEAGRRQIAQPAREHARRDAGAHAQLLEAAVAAQQVAHQHQRPAVAHHLERRGPPGRRCPPGRGIAVGLREAKFGIRDSTSEYLSDLFGSIQGILKLRIRRDDFRVPATASGRLGRCRRRTEDRRRALTARGRKVRAPQGREVANGDPGKPEGKRNRNHTADGRRSARRERRCAWRHRQG